MEEFARIVRVPVGRLQRAFKSFDYFETYHDLNITYVRFWLAVLVSGALIGVLFGGIHLFYHWLYDQRLLAMNSMTNVVWGGLGIWQAISLPIILAVCLLIVFVAPLAAGSGMSEVNGALNGLIFPRLFRIKTNFVKSVGLMLTSSTGLWIGPEAPMLQIGGSVALRVGEFFAEHHLSDKEKYDLICLGGAMGLACAFRSPLAGITLMIEGFALLWHHALVWPALCGVWLSAYLSALFATGFSGGTSLGLPPGGVFPYQSENQTSVHLLTELSILATAISLGVYGALFVKCTDLLERWAGRFDKKRKLVFTVAVCAVAFTAFAGFSVFSQTLFVGPHDAAIIQMIQPGPSESLTVYVMFFFSVAIQSLLLQFTPLPVGIFAPHIAIGAAAGRFFGSAIGADTAHVVAVCGAASGLVSYFRFPLTVTVLMMELTSDVLLSLPVLHAVVVTKLMADRFGGGHTVLDTLIKGKGLPVLRDTTAVQREALKTITIGEKSTQSVISFRMLETRTRLQSILERYPHLYYAVVGDLPDELTLGAITRKSIVHDALPETGTREDELLNLEPFLDHPPVIVDDRMEFLKAYRLFREKGVRRLLVVEHKTKQLLGLLTRSDFYRVFNPP